MELPIRCQLSGCTFCQPLPKSGRGNHKASFLIGFVACFLSFANNTSGARDGATRSRVATESASRHGRPQVGRRGRRLRRPGECIAPAAHWSEGDIGRAQRGVQCSCGGGENYAAHRSPPLLAWVSAREHWVTEANLDLCRRFFRLRQVRP